MSMLSTKTQLLAHLDNDENRVIALTGKWGTGKSHLWREVKSESNDEEVKRSIAASLFGVKSIEQVKLLLTQDAVNGSKKKSIFGGLTNAVSATVKGLEGLHKSFSVLSD
jgi:type II secretory pathway predicted ATPase ExeA